MEKKYRMLLIIGVVLIGIGVAALLLLNSKKDEDKGKDDKEPKTVEKVKLSTLDVYKNIKYEDIVKVEKIRFTEGGDNHEEYTKQEDIDSYYKMIGDINVGEETERSCEDNTTVYVFYNKDNTKTSFEIECDWIIIGNKRYMIK